MVSMKPICNHVIVQFWTQFLEINYFCAENNENYIYSCEKLHKKIAATRSAFLTQICTKSFVGWGFVPDPTGGAYSAPQTP